MPKHGEHLMNSIQNGFIGFLKSEPVSGGISLALQARDHINGAIDKIPGEQHFESFATGVVDLAGKAYDASPMGLADNGAEVLAENTSDFFNIDPRFLGLLVGMVRAKGDIKALKKLTSTDKATGNYGRSVQEAFDRGQSQYYNNNNELMDAGWSKAKFGSDDLFETHPFNVAKRKEASGRRRARQAELSYSLDDYMEAWGEKGRELVQLHKDLLKKVYAAAEDGFDVDHIASLAAKATPGHHPANLRIQNSSRNRSEGKRELPQEVMTALALANNKADQLRMHYNPKPTPFLRQKILAGKP